MFALTPAATLVGRREELANLDGFLTRVDQGPRALFLEGEAGIGKTRLWQEGLERARRCGFRVLSTHPGATEVQLAFAGLADLLDEVAPDMLPELPSPQRRALEIALLLEEPGGAPPDERAVAAAFLGCLRILADAGFVLVAVDDIQWLDAASARVLEFACRRLDSEPVGLLAAVRIAPDEAEPEELARAFGGGRDEHLVVGPLSVAALYELVRAHLDLVLSRPVLLRVHESSEGNPFFALELARALQRVSLEPVPGEPLPVPANLRELVRGRLALLPRPSVETLLLAAALARPAVPTLELAVGSGDRVQRDLEAAAQAGVIELQGDRIRFTHPLLASIHFSAAPPRARRATHRRLAAVVVDPEERARHLALAAEGPDAEVAATLADAAERATSRGAVAAAAELAEQALRLTPVELPEEAHRRLLVAAEQHYAGGNTVRAVELLEEALTQASAGPKRAELLWSLGKIRFEGQDTRVGLDFFRRALDETGDDDLLRARILASLTFPAGKQEGFPAAQAHAREAAALAERLGDIPTLARALAMLAHLKFLCGEGVATELFERAVALEDELWGLELDYGPTAWYAWTLSQAGKYDLARPLLERLCERGRASGDAAVHQPLFTRASLEFETGNWERAAELAREAYDVAVQTGREAAEPKGMFTLARIEAGRGEIDAARTRAEQALVLTDGRGWSSGGPRGVLGFLELSLENYQAAYEALMPAIERYRGLGAPLIGQTFDAAEALAGMARVREGRALLDRCEEAPGMMRLPWAIAAAARAQGLLAAAEGDLEGAQATLEAAVSGCKSAGSPLELGRSLLALGTVQRRARKKQAARRTLDRALEIFEQLGARLWAERARRELGRIGGRSAPRGALSATEAEIVELVVAGRSNKEVARALLLSPKTVEWNLSKIYRRLGVHSRTELAAARRTRV
jgi:DNA-binding CsgD family transcriptional regulator